MGLSELNPFARPLLLALNTALDWLRHNTWAAEWVSTLSTMIAVLTVFTAWRQSENRRKRRESKQGLLYQASHANIVATELIKFLAGDVTKSALFGQGVLKARCNDVRDRLMALPHTALSMSINDILFEIEYSEWSFNEEDKEKRVILADRLRTMMDQYLIHIDSNLG